MKVLVVAAEPVDDELVGVVSEEDEVRVVAPTIPGSPLRYWLNDTDAALERAEDVVEESVDRLDAAGVSVDADAPTDDPPSDVIEDALRGFDPDRVVVLKHEEEQESYREDELVETVENYTDVPVDVRTLPAGG